MRPRRWGALGQYALVLWVAVTLNFALPRLAPGDPLEYVIGPEFQTLTVEQRAEVLDELGLSGSLPQQYVRYMGNLFRGDFGVSIRFGRPVPEVLADRLPWTLLLLGPAFFLAFGIATALGVFAAVRRGGRADAGLLTGTLLLDALPAFWIAMVLLAVFSVRLGWFPSFGAEPLLGASSALAYGWEVGRRLVLPTATLVLASLGHTFLLARASMISSLGEDYIAQAEAAGLPPRRIIYRHALRNAVLPLYTHFALTLGGLVGGAVLVETVFGYPGVGRLIFEALSARDYPLLQASFLLVTLGVILANALADATYPLLDPRVRRRRQRGS